MKKKSSYSLFNISLIIFFLLVIARASIIFVALQKSNQSQDKSHKALRETLLHVDILDKGISNMSPKMQKALTDGIRNEVMISISQNELLAATSNKSLNFAIFSMIILSIIFVLIILKFNRKIKKDHQLLENTLSERETIEEKLAIQNTELIKANHELDNFVHSASHDLRAPLSSIIGLIHIMLQKETEVEKQNLLGMMKTSVEKLDFFIQDIIEYSRNSRGSVKIEKIDFTSLINESIQQFEYLEETKNIRFEIGITGEADFYSDKKRISVLLNNFISNSIKYYDPNKANPFIKISIKKYIDFADIDISDNGIGIQAIYLDKIFNMFYRATQSRTGSGIGLYIVKEVIEKMGGDIRVNSEEKKGTSFFVRFPNAKQISAVD